MNDLSRMSGEKILCQVLEHHKVFCNGTIYDEEEARLTTSSAIFWIYLGVYVFLMLFAGLCSGLTMGLLSLDITQLEILRVAGKPKEKKYSETIYPIVKRNHLLLVTLLLANALAVESMPIFMDRLTNPVIAIIVSVTAVLIFGEIIPQALCTRYGLAVGYYLSPLVKVLMLALFVIAWPISKFLDCLLGKSHATFFRRAELKVLVHMHQNDKEEENEEPLSMDEASIIKGALDLSKKVAKDSLVPIEAVFMLHSDTMLDMHTMSEIIDAGHSRIPIYERDRTNIIGLLLVKSIITLDPQDSVPVTDVMRHSKLIPKFPESEPLYNILNACQTGRSHICIITSEETKVAIGIITLEDILEEILQEEIVDETDRYIDVKNNIQVARLLQVLSYSKSRSYIHSMNESYGYTPTTDEKTHLLMS